jgi:DNA-binding GntR family transcriptional regulator
MPNQYALQLLPTQRQSLGDNIADLLREAIFQRVFEPGERLTEVAISSRLNVSRSPVREALAVLEREGLVNRTANKGAVIPRLAAQDAREICSMRGALEVLAVRQAMNHVTPALIARLKRNIAAQEGATYAEQMTLLDLEFHEIIVGAAENARLLAAWLSLRSQVRLLMLQRNLREPANIPWTAKAHLRLLEAIEARDEARAVQLAEEWADEQWKWICQQFSLEGDGPMNGEALAGGANLG